MNDDRANSRHSGENGVEDAADEKLLARLLKTAGRGPVASDAARQRIYATVHEAWRERVAAGPVQPVRTGQPGRAHRRRLTRRSLSLALAAGLAAIAVVTSMLQPPASVPGATFASITTLEGGLSVTRDGRSLRLDSALDDADRTLRVGDVIATPAGAGIALALPGGGDFRIDGGSELRLAAVDQARLINGTVYFDSRGRQSPLVIETAFGSVQHTGTQYLAEVDNSSLTLSVREGSVSVDAATGDYAAIEGESLTVERTGEPVLSTIASTDAAWRWTERLAALPESESERLADVLAWIARETGRRLEFADATAEARAADVLMSGLTGLTPDQALDALRETTALRITAADEGRLVISSL